jgi:hypothetical protein
MPVLLSVGGNLPSWRMEATAEIREIQLRTCLESLSLRFRLSDLAEILIIAPERDFVRIQNLISDLMIWPSCRLVNEESLCPELQDETSRSISGWNIQQIMKLSASCIVKTDLYLTLDTDILCVKTCGLKEFIKNGRALTNFQNPSDYFSLYRYGFTEWAVKFYRMSCAAFILKILREPRHWFCYYGETPALLHTATVRALTCFVEEKYGVPWRSVLLRRSGWTEYALYYSYAEQSGALDSFHNPGDRRSLLDLDYSIWLPVDKLRASMDYRRWPFVDNDASEQGYFVALQTWFDSRTWLPAEYTGLADYYAAVRNRLVTGIR